MPTTNSYRLYINNLSGLLNYPAAYIDIIVTSENNLCGGGNSGYISIDSIVFSDQAKTYFIDSNNNLSYYIQWSYIKEDLSIGSILLSQISSDGRTISSLFNGKYTCNIYSYSNIFTSNTNQIIISSPQQLNIDSVEYSKLSCDTNGQARVTVSGGKTPYYLTIGNKFSISENSLIIVDALESGNYELSVKDSNNCTVVYPDPIIIENSTIQSSITSIIPPSSYNSYGKIRFKSTGGGPFSIVITDSQNETILVLSPLDTTYVEKIDNDIYYYHIPDKIYPGSTRIEIINTNNCSAVLEFIMPNINPITTNLGVTADSPVQQFFPVQPAEIFDTILIPYQNIIDNSNLWQAIKQYNLKDNIKLEINNEIFSYTIVRNMSNKYCIQDDQIEILSLGNNSDNWYFYFYIAPSINLSDNSSLMSANINLIHNDEKFPITLGLSSRGDLDTENPSLIKGSFLLFDLGHQQFINGDSVNMKLNDPTNLTNYDYLIKNISKKILKNIYNVGFTTAINFLEQFDKLNKLVSIGQTSCNSTNEQYQYMLNFKNLLIALNNFNNLGNIYIYNLNNITHTGKIECYPIGNTSLYNNLDVLASNPFIIEYFSFNKNSTSLQDIYLGYNKIINTNIISGLEERYIIIRLKDSFGNISRFIQFNNITYNYDEHYVVAQSYLQEYNDKILPHFKYGDILVYLPTAGSEISEDVSTVDQGSQVVIITPPPSQFIPNLIEINPIEQNFYQTKDDSENTGSLTVYLAPSLIKTIIFGPKNYFEEFNINTKFNNLIPGVYIIKGDEQSLIENNLIQNEYRIIVDKNTDNTIIIEFISNNKISIRN